MVELFSKNRHSHRQMSQFLFSISALEAVVAAVIRRPNMAKMAAAVSVGIGILAESIASQAQNFNPTIEYTDVDFPNGVFNIPNYLQAIMADDHPNLESLA